MLKSNFPLIALGLCALIVIGIGTYNTYLWQPTPDDQPSKRFWTYRVYAGPGTGWWAHIEGNAYPFGPWRMDRGPYPFRWMAELEFPIERMTKDGPRR